MPSRSFRKSVSNCRYFSLRPTHSSWDCWAHRTSRYGGCSFGSAWRYSGACFACPKLSAQGACLNLPSLNITAVSQMQVQRRSQTVWLGACFTRGKPRHDLLTQDSRPFWREICGRSQASTVRAARKPRRFLFKERGQCRRRAKCLTSCLTLKKNPWSIWKWKGAHLLLRQSVLLSYLNSQAEKLAYRGVNARA